ncbi:hypothetical protein LPJ78_002294 [Coemansia sp. RSA 989]|nr:hypothetical protein BX667DRAFT_517341 [Coemansia mojavensis]KAJ1740101.1 hypothetical protein LPJ68_004085 [Coemansia sp. RSA 1086]KAJ1749079.1 hypothetical protein LPJ79_004007 [Coemansia sp. RSA 1821]KAJ1865894.1 hypothetical protein LPJ78_002294 [Coemansia sp. RSA 989]KAJ1873039.1 hypothetical protein LPJ55_002601 [Coemansia sp. RSA 990]KAJ2673367.1 hypothetical protein IWW42_002377 [Coemansia sp. RSA 1085]
MSSLGSGIYMTGQHFGSTHSRTTTSKPSLEFSLNEYLEDYKGYAKIRRAIFIGECCPELSAESYTIALQELEAHTLDTTTYTHVSKTLAQLTGQPAALDWIKQANKESKELDSEIKADLERAKKQVSKRDSLKAQRSLVQLLQRRGLMDESIRALQDGRSFCLDVSDQAQLHMEAARVSQLMCRWLQVATFVQRTESVAQKPSESLLAEMAVMKVQADFGDGKWSAAVAGLKQLSMESMKAVANGIVLPRDIALYGTLAGLASLQRDQIKHALLDNALFGQFLDSMPECLTLLQSFHGAKYTDVLACLDKIMSLCRLDPVISPHVATLEQKIRDNIVVLYIQPFMSIRLSSMAEALCFESAEKLEAVLVQMIDSRLIQARIDGTTGFLIKHAEEPRDQALRNIEKMHKEFSLQTELMTARIRFLEEESSRLGRVAIRR